MEVVGIGSPVFDFLINTDRLPEPDSGGKISEYSWQGGGKVATALVTLARLGAETSMLGVVGDGPYGQFCIKDFQKHGVDTSYLVVDEGKTGSFCVVISEKKSMSRSIMGTTSTKRQLQVKDLNKNLITSAEILHLERLDQVSRRAALWVREAGGKVVIDADSFSKEIDNNLELIDVFIGSEFYYKHKFESNNYRENCKKFQNKGPEIVIFTLGEKGCVGVYGDTFFKIPAFEVEVMDTNGAGDVFHGAFIYGLLQDWEIEETAEFATATAAIKCTRIGGRAGIPALNTVKNFIEKGKIDYSEIDKRVQFYKKGIFNYNLSGET